MSKVIRSLMASRLLSQEVRIGGPMVSRFKSVMEEVDMAIYGRGHGLGYVYGNLGDLLKKVQAVGASHRPTLFQSGLIQKDKIIRRDSMEQLKDNVSRLQEMQSRLQFMLTELEGLVKKG